MEDRLLTSLLSDLKTLGLESKRKYPKVREGCEQAISKLKTLTSSKGKSPLPLTLTPSQLSLITLDPILLVCETKDAKLVPKGVHCLQKLVLGGGLDSQGAEKLTKTLQGLLSSQLEELKVLQTITLLLTTNEVVEGSLLARNLTLAFRLQYLSKDQTTGNAAGATIRQLVALVFERIREREEEEGEGKRKEDAYNLLSDVIKAVNGEQMTWLEGGGGGGGKLRRRKEDKHGRFERVI